ncbi:tyrosine protein phosphatase [Priestia megaterium]|uniref:tyrosine-protein phosphatase n=1 Tax=Priestia megaterium TaxID=1404 RepID=UPI001C22E9E9|nr:CpsB/CapC family capsule biosynthesis tyrosine phosphatase [Priestia megaterium]MBU8686472.1 tyrosine protein phosphatase [Priestia megaterium]
MIDIHCHILPGIDDGARTIEDSLKMAEQAVAEGISKVIATPHHQNGKYINEKNSIFQCVNQLNVQLEEKHIPLTVLPGQESRIYGELVQDYIDDKVMSLNNTGKYVFIEFPSNQVPRYSEQLLFDIQAQGLIPIIVHPERNVKFIENPDLLYNFVNKGALTQVTAGSLTGKFGKKINKFSLDLIHASLTHVIASDAHNVSGRNFFMTEAIDLIKKDFGIDTLYLLLDNAQAIADGIVCFKEPPEKITRKKFLGIF